MKVVACVLVGAITIGIIVLAIGAFVWNRTTRKMVDELHSTERETPRRRSLESLPAPVARYLQTVFVGEPPSAQYVRLTQIGQFRLDDDENSWRPFRAIQHVNSRAPGFVWDARIQMTPLAPVHIRDAYVGSRGSMHGKFLSVVTVVDERDKDELNRGALHRYLAEAVWFPVALLPSERLQWKAIDARTAEATLSDADIEVSAIFDFNDAGEIVGVSAERYREVDGNYELTPWRGRFWHYETRGDIRLPLEGEVAWILPRGEYLYWRGAIVDYELS